MSLQIDNTRQIKFRGDINAVKQGYYTAFLPDQLYREFLRILAISELDRPENLVMFNIDASTYKLEVHYNNKVKFIKSSFFPYVTNDLLNYLLNLPKRVELKEAEPM